jgi:hypothetical protein
MVSAPGILFYSSIKCTRGTSRSAYIVTLAASWSDPGQPPGVTLGLYPGQYRAHTGLTPGLYLDRTWSSWPGCILAG